MMMPVLGMKTPVEANAATIRAYVQLHPESIESPRIEVNSQPLLPVTIAVDHMIINLRTQILQVVGFMVTLAWLLPVFAVVSSPRHAGDGSVALPWEPDYATALAKARSEIKPLFIMMSTPWCGPC